MSGTGSRQERVFISITKFSMLTFSAFAGQITTLGKYVPSRTSQQALSEDRGLSRRQGLLQGQTVS
jgi:hypothetical protein